MWFLLALLSGFFAAVLAVFIQLYLKHLNPFFITFLFAIVTVVLFLIIDICTKKIECNLITTLTSKEWLALLFAGCLNAIAFSCYVGALRWGKASGVVAIDRLGVLFVVILSVFFLQESFSIKTVLGSLIMVLGAVLVSW